MTVPETTVALHVDCDNLWSYEEEYGIPTSGHQELIYEQALPKFLEICEETAAKMTFFIIGSDLKKPACRRFCNMAIAAGHRIANHTHTHPARFSSMSYAEKRFEIEQCDKYISDALGIKAIGFRAPGYYFDKSILEILQELGYAYDTSVLPGFSHYLMHFRQYLVGANKTGKSFGRGHYICASRSLRRLDCNQSAQPFFEVPIATLPFFRMPVHTTFVYMFGYHYLDFAFSLMRRNKGHHVYLFHAADLLDHNPANEINKLPAFRLRLRERENIVRSIITSANAIGITLTENYIETLTADTIPKSALMSKFL